MPTLNDRHFAVLRFIRSYHQKHHFAPTIREIGRQIGVDSTSLVDYYLDGLMTAGLITREKRIARSIVLLPKGEAELTGAQA